MFSVVSVRQSFCPLGVTFNWNDFLLTAAAGGSRRHLHVQVLPDRPEHHRGRLYKRTSRSVGHREARRPSENTAWWKQAQNPQHSCEYSIFTLTKPPTLWCILYTHTQNSHHSGAYSILPLKTLTTLVHNLYSYSPNSQHSGAYSIVTLTNPQYSHSKPSILWCILYTQTQNPEHSNWKPKIQVVLVAMSNFLNCRNCGLRISLGVSYVSSCCILGHKPL